VWIDFFNGRDTPETKLLRIGLHETPEQVYICDIIFLELLSGFPLGHQRKYELAKKVLECFDLLELRNRESAISVIRRLRDKGITLKGFQNGLLDVIIAQTALDNSQSILTANLADFRKIAEVTGLAMEEV
jgi:predicted nucleic acid-binding protein